MLNKLVINLPEREDRLNRLLSELPKVFDDCNFDIIDGVKMKEPQQGIAIAHQNAVMYARDNSWDHVLIMEDDCVFPAGGKTKHYFEELMFNAPENYDILLGGAYGGKIQKHNQYWHRITNFCGLHFYVISHRFYDKFLSHEAKNGHIDRWVNMYGVNNVYLAAKTFAIQSNGFSDNVGKEVNYDHYLNKFEMLK